MLLYFTCNFYQYGVHVWVIYLLLHNFQCRRLECISVAPPAQLMRVLIKMCPVQWTALFYGGKTWPTDCSWLYTRCNFHSEGENIVGVNITTALHIEGQFSMYSFPDSAVQGRDSLGMRLANNCVLIFCLMLVSHTSRFLLKWMLQLARLGLHFFQYNENTTIISIVTIYLSFVLLLDNTRHL